MTKTLRNFITALLLFALLIVPCVSIAAPVSAAEARADVINVFSWEDYIDVDILDEFTDETGIKVNYYTFATNEEMYNEILKDPKSCDLACPSEYMIMKMMKEDLIKPYEMPQSYIDFGSRYIKNVFDELDINQADGTTYAIGYMWGTMGNVYNTDKVDAEDLTAWKGLLNRKYKGKITIKDSVRDSYIMALAIVYEEELNAIKTLPAGEYETKIAEIFNRTDDETIKKVKDVLTELKQNLYGFEVDSGKSDILTGKIDINFAWSGDAVYSMDEGDAAGVNLSYIVPEEGSNVWFDGWVMPKAASTAAATEFLDFLSRPENAVRNMEYIGYTSCVAGDEVFDYVVDSYGAEQTFTVYSEEEKAQLIEDEEYAESDFAAYGDGYAVIDTYGSLIEEDGVYYLDAYEFTEDGEYVYVGKTEVYPVDLKYFFDPDCTDDTYVVYSLETGRQLYAQYSDEETINRCAVMQDFSDDALIKVNEMWNTVKLITMPVWLIIVIVAAIVIIIVLAILYKFKDKIIVKKVPEKQKAKDTGDLTEVSRKRL